MPSIPHAITVLCHATALPDPSALPPARGGEDEWITVEDRQADGYAPRALKADLIGQMGSPKLLTHCTTPLGEDRERLGAKRFARQTALNIEVFTKEAKKVLASVPGPVMRTYYQNLCAGQKPSLCAATGLTLKSIDNFCEDFRNLRLLEAHTPLRRPIFLAAAARLAGGESGGGETVRGVMEAAQNKITRLYPLVCELQDTTDLLHLTLQQDEVLALYRLLVVMTETLTDPTVEQIIAPPAPWKAWAKTWAQASADSVVAGVQKLNTQAGTALAQHFPNAMASSKRENR